MRGFLSALVMVGTALALGQSHASEPSTSIVRPCDTPLHREFDFWIGDWQVFDAHTGKLVGFDRVTKELMGCAVVQHFVFLSDAFRRADLNYRLSGISISMIRDDHWLMAWTDTYGGSLVVDGHAEKDGGMVFETTVPSHGKHTRGEWAPNADGSVRNTGYQSADGKKSWSQYFDYIYKRNE